MPGVGNCCEYVVRMACRRDLQQIEKVEKAYLQCAGEEKDLSELRLCSVPEFKNICHNNGAPNIFGLIFACMTSP